MTAAARDWQKPGPVRRNAGFVASAILAIFWIAPIVILAMNAFKTPNEFLMTNGFAPGAMIVRRVNGDDARWFATKTLRESGFGPIFMRDEIVTPNLPEKVKNAFEGLASARGEAARQRFTNGAQQSQPAQEASHDDEIPFGEPDHSGGLTPS